MEGSTIRIDNTHYILSYIKYNDNHSLINIP